MGGRPDTPAFRHWRGAIKPSHQYPQRQSLERTAWRKYRVRLESLSTC